MTAEARHEALLADPFGDAANAADAAQLWAQEHS